MRRAMLTAKAATASLSVGLLESNSGNTISAACIWSTANPCTANGTITSVDFTFNDTDSTYGIAFFIISPAGVIRSIGSNTLALNGTHTYTVSLACQTGDYIGFYRVGFNNTVASYHTHTGYTIHRHFTTTTKPSAGNTRASETTDSNAHLNLIGT